MSSKKTKAKRKALPRISLKELIDKGELPEFYHLQDHVDLEETRKAQTSAGMRYLDHLVDKYKKK